MKLSFCTLGCPDWTLYQAVERARPLGFEGIEIRGAPGEHIGPDEPVSSRLAIRLAFDEAGVRPVAIMGYSRFTHDDLGKRRADIESARKFIDVAHDIGCPMLRVFGGKLDGASREQAIDRVVASLGQLTPHARQAGVKIVLETHDAWCGGKDVRAVIDGVASPALGVCWDICNTWWTEPLHQTYSYIKDHIAHVHLKDAIRFENGQVHARLPGAGQVDLPSAMTMLHQGGYKEWLSFEWEKKWEPSLEDPQIAFPHFVRFATTLMEKAGIPRDQCGI